MSKNFPYNVMRHRDWDKAPRIEAIATSIIAATGATSTLAIAAIYVGTYIAVSAVTSWAISALSPKPDFSSFGSQGTLVNARDATAPVDFVYGQVRKGGTVSYYESTDSVPGDNRYLNQIICLAGHEVEEIGDIYVNDEIVTLNSDHWVTETRWSVKTVGPASSVAGVWYNSDDSTFYKSHLRIESFDGSQTNPPFYLLARSQLTGSDALTNDFVGNGIAYLYAQYTYDADVFASGVPIITALVKGKKVYDPRTSTIAYSNNAALCIRDFITSTYGLNDSAIDDVSFSVAANESDEDVRLSNIVDAGNFVIGQQYEIKTVGTTDFTAIGASANTVGQVFLATGVGSGTGDAYRSEKRYTINGIVKASSPTGKVLGDMATACAGTLFWGSGYWKLKVGAYTAPVKTLTLDDLRGPINLQTRSSTRDSFNGVGGTFNNADGDFITADYPAIKSDVFKTEDGGDEMLLDLPLPFTTSASTAQRIAKMTLYRGREQMTINADFGLEAFNIEVGDIIAFDNDRYGFDGKEFEVIGWKFASNQEAGDLRVTLTLQETSEAAFDWNAEESEIISHNTNLPIFNTVSTPTNLTLTAQAPINGDGTTSGSIFVEWDASADAFVSYYEVQHKISSDTEYSGAATSLTSHNISPTISSTLYDVRVRGVSGIDVKSEWVEAQITSARDQTAPAVPTAVSASAGYRQNIVNWTNPSDLDLSFIQIYAHTSNNSAAAGIIGTIKGTEFIHGDLPEQTTRYYWVKSVDTSGNISGFSAVASATTLADPQDGTDGTDGTDGATGDTIVTGRVYYQILQSGQPGDPDASSYNTSTGTFSGLTSNWLQTQPSVDITDTGVKEWSSQFQVTIDGTTSVQTIDFTTPSGAIQVTADIESDNYNGGGFDSNGNRLTPYATQGWHIDRSSGSAEFQNAIIRGTLDATDIIAGTLTADRINLTGSQLESSSGALIVSDSGIDTQQVAVGAISGVDSSYTSSGNVSYATGSGSTIASVSTFANSGDKFLGIITVGWYSNSTSSVTSINQHAFLGGAGMSLLFHASKPTATFHGGSTLSGIFTATSSGTVSLTFQPSQNNDSGATVVANQIRMSLIRLKR